MVIKRLCTLTGLFIAYVSLAGISFVFRQLYGKSLDDLHVIARELLIFLMAALLIWIIRKERFPLT